MNSSENCWPNPDQQLLLQASLLPSEIAEGAWNEYCKRMDLNEIDHVSVSMLPLVYANLKPFTTPQLNKCKSVYRHTWTHNHLLLFKAKMGVEQLRSHSIEASYLKGAAMIFGYYKDPGLRVIGDVDILVPASQAKKAIATLIQSGWIPESRDLTEEKIETYFDLMHAVVFRNREGHAIDLHWRVLADSGIDPILAGFAHRLSKVGEASLFSPEDQLIHTLFHGLKYSPLPLIRWIPDAVWILRQSTDFDWDYFQLQARKLQIEYSVNLALQYLNKSQFVSIPDEILKALLQYKPIRKEIRYHRFATQKPRQFISVLQKYWHAHVRSFESDNWFLQLATWPRFIKNARKIPHWHQFIFFLCQAAYCRAKKSFI